jgi:DNA-binding MarR family transcriptional regulator
MKVLMSAIALAQCVQIARSYSQGLRKVDGKLGSIHGLSFNDFLMLHYLEDAPDSKLRRIDLAELMGLTASAVTRALLPLEKIGLVTRQSDPSDARVGFACLTAVGKRVFKDAKKTAEADALVDAGKLMPMG